MRASISRSARLLVVPCLLGMGAPEAVAAGRGIGFGGPSAYGVGPARIGPGRFGLAGRRNGRFPGAIYGAGLVGPWDAPSQVALPPASPLAAPERLDVWSYSKSVVIHRGPSFGEPGYVSEPVVLRLHPAGPGQFRVERIRP